MTQSGIDDSRCMGLALREARRAGNAGEVPVGAVVFDAAGKIAGRGANRTVAASDPTGHAEIRALRAAARRMKNYRLPGTTLYVTLEPCLMCVGAMVHARVARLVYGTADPKVGAVQLAQELAARHAVNHRFEVSGGVRLQECRTLLEDYFRERR